VRNSTPPPHNICSLTAACELLPRVREEIMGLLIIRTD
jgi:hypothetical protein